MVRLSAVVLILVTITFLGCRDEGEQTPPIITSFEPTSGIAGALVTIHGGNFGEGPAVFLNDTPLELNSVADDRVIVTIPEGAATGKIKVVNNGAETVTSDDFVVLFSPTITGFTPDGGGLNEPVTITGTNFIEGTTVFFGDVNAPILSRTLTSISTIIPNHSYPAKIRVTTPSGSALSSEMFIAFPPAIISVKPLFSDQDLTVTSPGQRVIITTISYANAEAPKSLAFNGIPLINVESGVSGIKAEIPAGVQTGKFTITVNDYTVTYDPLITVITGEGEWMQPEEFPGSVIGQPAGFKIGDYYYYGIGAQLPTAYPSSTGPATQEFWKFNPATASWTQMPSFPAAVTYGSPSQSVSSTGVGTFSFAVNGQGYVSGGAGGVDNRHASKEFYRFDPVAELWTKMSDLSDELAQPHKNFGFSCNGKGYVWNINSGVVNEYDPDNDTWIIKSTVPGSLPVVSRAQFVANNKAYILLSRTDSPVDELWQYDPIANVWDQKNDYPGPGHAGFAFEMEENGYIGSATESFWKFIPTQDLWVQLPTMPNFLSGPAFSFGKKGFVMASTTRIFPNPGYSRLYTFQLP